MGRAVGHAERGGSCWAFARPERCGSAPSRGRPPPRRDRHLAVSAQLPVEHSPDAAEKPCPAHGRAGGDRRATAEADAVHCREAATIPFDEALQDAGHRWRPCRPARHSRSRRPAGPLPAAEPALRTHVRRREGLHTAAQIVRLSRHPPRLPIPQHREPRVHRAARGDPTAHETAARMGDGGGDGWHVPRSVSQVERGSRRLAAFLRAGGIGVRTGGRQPRRSQRPW